MAKKTIPDISQEEALATLLRGKQLQRGPNVRGPVPLEAVVPIGKNNHAYIAIQPEDLAALQEMFDIT